MSKIEIWSRDDEGPDGAQPDVHEAGIDGPTLRRALEILGGWAVDDDLRVRLDGEYIWPPGYPDVRG